MLINWKAINFKKIKIWLFESNSKINKPLPKLTNSKRQKIQITNIRNERGDKITDIKDI